MKIHNLYAVMAAGAFITTVSTQLSLAQPNANLVPASVQLTCVTTNSSGNLAYESVGTRSFIKECASETVVELQSYVFVETNSVASGVLTATERLFPGTTNHPPTFTLIGQLNYTEPASGTNPPAICHGTLFVGSLFPFFPHFEDDAVDRDSSDPGQGTNIQSGSSSRN